MKPDFSADELARFLDRPPSELLALRDAGLIDLDRDDCFDDLDLVRAQVLRDYLDQGYSPPDLADAIRDGRVEPLSWKIGVDQWKRVRERLRRGGRYCTDRGASECSQA